MMTPRKQTAAKSQATQPVVPTTSASENTAPTPANKQTATFDLLKAAWIARGVDLTKTTIVPDGKAAVVTVAEGWPKILIGFGGGVSIPQLRSYPSAIEAAKIADQLLQKQVAKDAKKSAPAQPRVAPKPEVKQTVTAKKRAADQKLEQQLQQA